MDGEGGGSAPAEKKEEPKQEAAPQEEPQQSTQAPEQEEVKKGQQPVASPSARKLAREKGIDLTEVPTVDPLGRVRKQDVESLIQIKHRHRRAQSLSRKKLLRRKRLSQLHPANRKNA